MMRLRENKSFIFPMEKLEKKVIINLAKKKEYSEYGTKKAY
jgi:hypothetical protein